MDEIQSIIESFTNLHPHNFLSENDIIMDSTVCPYFTPEEIEQLEGYYSDYTNPELKALYKGQFGTKFGLNTYRKSVTTKMNDLEDELKDTEADDREEIEAIRTRMASTGTGVREGFTKRPGSINTTDHSWQIRLDALQLKLKTAKTDEEADQVKQDMVTMGWNPEIEYNAKNQQKAKDRYLNILKDRYSKVDVIDASTYVSNLIDNELDSFNEATKEKLYPIHVVLTKGNNVISNIITQVTNSEFSHAALSLDDKVEKLYSFNFDNKYNLAGGFSLESIKDYVQDNRLAVYTLFVTKKVHDNVSDAIQNMLNNIKNTIYSIGNLVMFPFKHIVVNKTNDSMICSQFVDSILKLANINITDGESAKISPNSLYLSVKNSPKAYKTFDGIAKDFDGNKIKRFINKLQRTAISASESGMLEYVVIEARKIPIEFNADGDMLLTNPYPDYNDEYFNSHRLLLSYEKSGNLEGIKYELARLYYMNYKIERLLYHNKNLAKKQENMKIRARILNDFNKYLKYVNSKDKSFNFSEYYEQSPFYPHTVVVKSTTIGQLKNVINYIL